MTTMIMPMRFNIIKHLIENEGGMTPKQLYNALSGIYKGEGQCTEEELDKQLMSLKIVCLAEVASSIEMEDGSLESTYRITDYGKKRARQHIGEYL